VNEFSPRKNAAWNGRYLSLSVIIDGRFELLRLSAEVRVVLGPEGAELHSRLALSPIPCRVKRKLAK
jgi:hypothetical protein